MTTPNGYARSNGLRQSLRLAAFGGVLYCLQRFNWNSDVDLRQRRHRQQHLRWLQHFLRRLPNLHTIHFQWRCLHSHQPNTQSPIRFTRAQPISAVNATTGTTDMVAFRLPERVVTHQRLFMGNCKRLRGDHERLQQPNLQHWQRTKRRNSAVHLRLLLLQEPTS